MHQHNNMHRDCWQWRFVSIAVVERILGGKCRSLVPSGVVWFSWNCCQGFSRLLPFLSFIAAVRPSQVLSSSCATTSSQPQPPSTTTTSTTSPPLSSHPAFPSPLFTPATLKKKKKSLSHLADIFALCSKPVNVLALLEWSCLHLISLWAETGKIYLPA